MSKRWSVVLFSTVFLLLFLFFQFESESRKRLKHMESRLMEMRLQVQTLRRTIANQSTATNVAEIQKTQDFIIKEFRAHRKSVVELLEVLVAKDERFERELEAYLRRDGFRVRAESDSSATSSNTSSGTTTSE